MFLEFFTELRKARVPATPREFLDLMRALEQDVADHSAEDFYRLSRALLVKDERHLDAFDVVFAQVFKGALSLSEAVGAVEIPRRNGCKSSSRNIFRRRSAPRSRSSASKS